MLLHYSHILFISIAATFLVIKDGENATVLLLSYSKAFFLKRMEKPHQRRDIFYFFMFLFRFFHKFSPISGTP